MNDPGISRGFARRGAGLSLRVVLCLGLVCPAMPAAPAPDRDHAERAKIEAAIGAGARYAGTVLLDAEGAARGDYDAVRGVWHPYEVMWHTGQLIEGLVAAYRVTGDDATLMAARRAGNWWVAQAFPDGHPLAGMVNARHGGAHGDLINFTTLSDGTPGLYSLSRITGDRRYADVATRAGAWTLERLYLESEGLIYNFVDPATGTVLTDRSPHHPDVRDPRLEQVARPSAEGFLYLDMYRHTREPLFLRAFLRLADELVERQGQHGFWMDFEPNDPATGKIHPRFNLWYAEALIEGYVETGERRYFDAALRTLRATARMQADDGALHYDTYLDGRRNLESVTGSAVAFAGLLWLRASQLGAGAEFDTPIARALAFVLNNRFPTTHADENLAGGFLETWVKRRPHGTEIQVRDIATAFALRFLAAWFQHRWPDVPAPSPDWRDASSSLALGHPLARRRQSLDGSWRYYLDPFEVAYRKPRGRRRDLASDLVPAGNELIEYDWASAPALTVPGDWNTQDPALLHYEGMVWYRRRFDADLRAGERQFLYFEGANYRVTVWLNGVRVGVHEGGFIPFSFEVTGKLRERDNSIVVAVDNARSTERIPSVDFDWHNYGGLIRPVHLLHVPQTHLRDWRAWLSEDGGIARLQVSGLLDGPECGGRVLTVRVPELGLSARVRADRSGRFDATLALSDFRRWSPRDPHLYEVTVAHAGEQIGDRIGLRTVRVDGDRILLNGRPVFLAGISMHDERLGPDGGRVRSADEARALLDSARALNANFVRLAHYPHPVATVRATDELGLLSWAEIPVYWDEVGYADPDVFASAQRQLRALVHRDFNRASVLIWSLANETTPAPARDAFLVHLAQDLRVRDRTRLLTAALNKNPEIDGVITVTDPLGETFDVIAVNQYEGWYGSRTPDQIDEVSLRSVWNKPLIISEFGADAPIGFHAGRDQRWSLEYQAHLYERTLSLMERTPHLAGISPWVLKDFRSPRRFHSRFQQYWNRKGLLSERGERKPAFDVLADWYRRRLESAP